MRAVDSTTHERPSPSLDLDREVQPTSQDVPPKQPHLLGLGDGQGEVLHGERVLGPHVDEPLVHVSDGMGGDDHPFDHGVGIALEHAAVHERAGISLVSVADDVLGGAVLSPAQFPFPPGWEPGPTPAPEAGPLYLRDHGLRGHGQGFRERGIPPSPDVVPDVGGIDPTAVAEDDPPLLLVERNLIAPRHWPGLTLVQEARDRLVPPQGEVHDPRHIERAHLEVQKRDMFHGHEGPPLAPPLTAGGGDLYRETPAGDLAGKGLKHFFRTRRAAPRAAANPDPRPLALRVSQTLPERP